MTDPEDRAAAPVLERFGPRPSIAVLRASRIGDMICALPALYDLKQTLPHCSLTLICLPLVVDLARRAPFIDRIVPFPGYPGIADQFFAPRPALLFFRRMQAASFDLAIQMHGSGVYSNPVTLMFGAGLTAGWVAPGAYELPLDVVVPFPDELSEVSRCRAFVNALGARSAEPRTAYLALSPTDRSAALALLGGRPRPWIGIHPRARDLHKVWRWEAYQEVARALLLQTGGTVLLLGSGDDTAPGYTNDSDLQWSSRDRGVVDLRGRTALPTLAALVASLDLFLGNDSGPAHMANLFDTPSVTIFGGTDPDRWGAREFPSANPIRHSVVVTDASCRPCEPGDCRSDFACLEEIRPESVLRQALRLLETTACSPTHIVRKKNEPAITGGL